MSKKGKKKSRSERTTQNVILATAITNLLIAIINGIITLINLID